MVEVRIPLSSHTGLTDPATSLNLQTGSVGSSDGFYLPVDEFTAGIARNLRERKPIQLNPYLLEEQRYNSVWKSRGLRPIKYFQQEPILPSNKNQTEKDSQEDDWVVPAGGDDETQADTIQPTQSFNTLENDSLAQDAFNLQSSQDGGLPALDELFNRASKERPPSPGIQSTASGTKRQKTKHPLALSARTKKIIAAAKASVARGQNVANHPDALPQVPVAEPKVNRLPQSKPPRTPAAGAKKPWDIFDLDSSDPEPLVSRTPASTSRRRIALESDESGNEGNVTPRPGSPAANGESSTSDDSSGSMESDTEVREQEIHKLQRRVRGVLPASYLRLNQPGTQGQINKTNAPQNHSPERRPMVKGMAQMRIRTGGNPPAGSVANPLKLSSGESSDENDSPLETPRASSFALSSLKPSASSSTPAVSSARSYAFETDTVDRMWSRPKAPNSGTTKTKASKSKLSKQSKLAYQSSHSHRTGSRRQIGPPKPRPKPAALSVVDACKRYRETRGLNPPRFLRIAERRAKKRKDAGRHLPDRKIIKFDRIYDDETDGEDTLTKWRRAKLVRSSSISSIAEAGIHSANAQVASSLRRLPDVNSKQPEYLQTKLPSQNSLNNQLPPAKSKLKPKITYKAMPKATANIPRQESRRIDHLLKKLQRPVANDPIEDDGPDLRGHVIRRDADSQKRPHADWVNRPAEQYIVTTRSEANTRNGKMLTKPTKRRKPAVPKRIDRHRSPTAFQPPEMNIRRAEPMEIDSGDQDVVSFESMPPRGTHFSKDFDIAVPQPKNLFHESSFIGSSCLFKALEISTGKTVARSRPGSNLQTFFGESFDWSVYDESVASQLESCLSHLLANVEKCLNGALTDADCCELILETRRIFRYVVEYLYRSIHFSDLIDITSFAARISDIISDVVSKTSSINLVYGASKNQFTSLFRLEIYSYAAIVLYEISAIIGSDETTSMKTRVEDLRTEVSEGLILSLMGMGLLKLQQGFSRAFQNVLSLGKLDETTIYLESWIVAYHTSLPAKSEYPQQSLFWENVNSAIGLAALKNSKDVESFETAWRTIFRLLPLCTVNSRGKIEPLEINGIKTENWRFADELIGRALAIYNGSRPKAQLSANGYIKGLYSRCLVLIRDWNWLHPDRIIKTLYDFFAKRKLQNLKDEQDIGSPTFLQHLDAPIFDSKTSETCFSIFLKIVALGLDKIRTTSGDRAAGDLANRINPNHGRVFLKEEDLAMGDLNTLRNHHDLLTAIYYGIGSAQKKRTIGIIRNLVDPEKSHSEVCSLSLRTWANIMTFELASNNKTREVLEDLMKWHSKIMLTTIQLHKELKLQAEQERKMVFDPRRIEDINKRTRSNNKELEGILFSGVRLLSAAFKSPNCDFYSAQLLLTADSVKTIFGMAHYLPQKLVAEAVEIVSSHVKVCREFGFTTIQDDSQMSWAGFEDAESDEIRKEAGKKLLDEIYDPLFDLINSYFAAEEKHLDQALIPCIQVWIELGSLLVQCGFKTWDDYFNAYRKSWFSMVDTDNKKTYSVSYVANIMKIDSSVYESHKPQILQVWVSSLVERDSLLKFQHELTSMLFNYDLSNVLFSNMPFVVDTELEKYAISLRDFKAGRLSLLSTLLENMQREMSRLQSTNDQRHILATRMEYSRILQDMMNAMRKNYTEIQSHQQATAVGAANKAASAYVTFCQQVVKYLQQYATDFCAIDKFFVDSVTFPLPTNDPTYVTSKLKGYGLKIQVKKPGSFVQFLQFFQNTCGRVAVEAQQGYFVEQILGAFEGEGERQAMEEGKRTLREVCMLALFGGYIRRSMEGLANLVLAAPVLVVAEKVVRGLVREFDGLEEGREMDGHISNFLVGVLEAVVGAVDGCIAHKELVLNEPLAVYMLDLLARLVLECDYIVNLLHPRVNHVSEGLSQDLLKVAVRALSRLKACLNGRQQLPEKLDMVMFHSDLPFKAEREMFEEEFRKELRNWGVGEGKEILLRKGGVKKVVGWMHLVDKGGEGVENGRKRLAERVDRVLEIASKGVCEGVVREVDVGVWEKARRPLVGMVDMLFGVGANPDQNDWDLGNVFDMDD
ncbi:hypothetical protein ABW20_dc0107029 [Dactylellina cionopaga]|nr:hypothetical protein ABW20_dc0107029 [Dactylellina cionopaga]